MYKRRAVFLDKNGTLIEDVPYKDDPGRVVLAEGAANALAALAALDYRLVVISNESGISLGRLDNAALERIESRIRDKLRAAGVMLDAFYYCPHVPALRDYRRTPACDCRKPEPGLMFRAAQDLGLDLGSSWLIGDVLDDVEAGDRAGCATILLDNGNETEWRLGPRRMPDRCAYSLGEAAQIIVEAERHACAVSGS